MSKSELVSFSFTYKRNTRVKVFPTIEDYSPVLDMLNMSGKVTHFVYEEDKSGKLHIHGIALLPRDVRYTKLRLKGYTYNIKPIYNLEGWLAYLDKDKGLAKAWISKTEWLSQREAAPISPDYTKNLMPRRSERAPMDAKKLFIEDDKLFHIQACPDDPPKTHGDTNMKHNVITEWDPPTVPHYGSF